MIKIFREILSWLDTIKHKYRAYQNTHTVKDYGGSLLEIVCSNIQKI